MKLSIEYTIITLWIKNNSPRIRRSGTPVAPALSFARMLDVNSVECQPVLVGHAPHVNFIPWVVPVYRQPFFVAAVGGALGAVLGAETAEGLAAHATMCSRVVWEADATTGHFHFQSAACGKQLGSGLLAGWRPVWAVPVGSDVLVQGDHV